MQHSAVHCSLVHYILVHCSEIQCNIVHCRVATVVHCNSVHLPTLAGLDFDSVDRLKPSKNGSGGVRSHQLARFKIILVSESQFPQDCPELETTERRAARPFRFRSSSPAWPASARSSSRVVQQWRARSSLRVSASCSACQWRLLEPSRCKPATATPPFLRSRRAGMRCSVPSIACRCRPAAAAGGNGWPGGRS